MLDQATIMDARATLAQLTTSLPFASISATGSRETCAPEPVNSDADFLVVVSSDDDLSTLVGWMTDHGFQWEGGEHYQMAASNDFMSWRNGLINLIVTKNAVFAQQHKLATSVCKRLNLMRKEDRVAVFRAFLYGEIA